MGNERVYLDRIDEYDVTRIAEIIGKGLDFIGVNVPSGCRILLKPNVLGAYPPELYIDTHPAVVEAVIRILKERNNTLILGDSSGNGQYGNTARSLEKSGMNELGKRYGITVIPFDKHTNRVFRNETNHIFKEINLTSFIDEVDWIVNLPKLKSHTFTVYSGAVKNFYGMIPGAGKPHGHVRAPKPFQFSDGLLDIYSFVRPKLLFNVMDGIVGIEGAGPGPAGKIRKTGFIGIGADSVALDYACLEVLTDDPEGIPVISLARKRGLLDSKPTTNQRLPRVAFILPKPSRIEAFFNTIFPKMTLSKPFVTAARCRSCGLCAKACPGGAISMGEKDRQHNRTADDSSVKKDSLPEFDYSQCIYCFCCHENCPEAAIDLKENWLFKIFRSMS